MNKLPEEWVRNQLAHTGKIMVFGVPLEELSHEELLAAAIFAAKQHEKIINVIHGSLHTEKSRFLVKP